MKAVFCNRRIRTALLVAAMVTAYFLGRSITLEQTNAATTLAEATRLAKYRREHTPMYLANIKNSPPDTRGRRQLNTVRLGKSLVSMDELGRFYINGEDLGKLAALDPQAALALLAALPHGQMTSDAYRSFFQQWAELGPEARASAVAAATGLPQGPEKVGVVSGLAVAWAKDDPKAALDWAAELGDANAPALVSALATVNVTQPALSAQYVQKIANAELRNEAIADIAANWGNCNWNKLERTDTAATLDWLNEVATGETYDKAVRTIFWSYAYMDPTSGEQLLDKIADPQDRGAIISYMSLIWTNGRPAAAMDWLQTLPDTDAATRDATLVSTFAGWSAKNPDAASAYISGITDPALFLKLAPSLAPALAKQDPQSALNWVNGFPDGAAKTQAMSGVLGTMAATNFDGAWNYAENLPPGPARDGALDSVISTLSKTNAAQAATRLNQLGSEAAQVSAVTYVAGYWARQDPAGLAQWIGSQPIGAVRDEAVGQYLTAPGAKDPASALALANSLSTDTMRAAGIRSVVLGIAKVDLAAATQAAQSANLTDDQRQNLLILLSRAPEKEKPRSFPP